jgi:hypothetical protein
MTAEPRIEWGTRSGGLQAAAHLEEAGSKKPAAHSRHVGGRARQRLRAAGMQLLAQLQLQTCCEIALASASRANCQFC